MRSEYRLKLKKNLVEGIAEDQTVAVSDNEDRTILWTSYDESFFQAGSMLDLYTTFLL